MLYKQFNSCLIHVFVVTVLIVYLGFLSVNSIRMCIHRYGMFLWSLGMCLYSVSAFNYVLKGLAFYFHLSAGTLHIF